MSGEERSVVDPLKEFIDNNINKRNYKKMLEDAVHFGNRII